MLNQSIKIIEEMQYPTGLFAASNLNVKTGYNLSWIRDNIYESLGMEAIKDFRALKKTFRALLVILLKHEYKIDYVLQKKPEHKHEYIHARYNPETFCEETHELRNTDFPFP